MVQVLRLPAWRQLSDLSLQFRQFGAQTGQYGALDIKLLPRDQIEPGESRLQHGPKVTPPKSSRNTPKPVGTRPASSSATSSTHACRSFKESSRRYGLLLMHHFGAQKEGNKLPHPHTQF